MDTDRIDALQKLPALKGAALSIVMAMLIAQRPLKAQELESFTGYSNQAISKGIRTLTHFRAIIPLGKNKGYSLAAYWKQLALPMSYPQDNHEIHDYLPSVVVDLNTLNSERVDHQQQTSEREDNHDNHDYLPESSSTVAILRRIGVNGSAVRRFANRPAAPVWAWWYEALPMALNNPAGWVICRLRDGDVPDGVCLELATLWLDLGEEERTDFDGMFTGKLPEHVIIDLINEYDFSRAAAELAVKLRPLGVFDE